MGRFEPQASVPQADVTKHGMGWLAGQMKPKEDNFASVDVIEISG
jgi:hypothetical protein